MIVMSGIKFIMIQLICHIINYQHVDAACFVRYNNHRSIQNIIFIQKSSTLRRDEVFWPTGVVVLSSMQDNNNNSQEDNDVVIPNNNDNDTTQFSNFNPFKYNAATVAFKTSSSVISDSVVVGSSKSTTTDNNSNNNSIISLRQQQMQQLTNELFLVVGGGDDNDESNNTIQNILQEYRDFLLEPLEYSDAVLDENMIDIYQNCITREDRYEAYNHVMIQRITNAKNGIVKKILTSIKDFVQSYK